MSGSDKEEETQNGATLETLVTNSELVIASSNDELLSYLNDLISEAKIVFSNVELVKELPKNSLERCITVLIADDAAVSCKDGLNINYKAPILLVTEKKGMAQRKSEFNVHNTIELKTEELEKQKTLFGFSVRDAKHKYFIDIGEFSEVMRDAIYKKLELDELCKRFSLIDDAINNPKRIDEEIYYVGKGDHGITEEEKATYWLRGPARPISKFEAAHLVAIEKADEIKRKGSKMDLAQLISIYADLYKKTNAAYFEEKTEDLFDYSDKTGKWLLETVDVNDENHAYTLGMWLAQHPQLIGGIGQITRYRHDIIEYFLGDQVGNYIFKVDSSKSGFLRKEKMMIDKFRELNKKIKSSKGIGRYVDLPTLKRHVFKDGFDFLMFSRARGQSVYELNLQLQEQMRNSQKKIVELPSDNSNLEKSIVQCNLDKKREEFNKKIEELNQEYAKASNQRKSLADQVLHEAAKICAMGHSISLSNPDLVAKVHNEQYYLERIAQKFVGSSESRDYAEVSQKGRHQPRFKGGLATIVEDKSELSYLNIMITENSKCLAKIAAGMPSGIVTDRSELNMIKGYNRLRMVDFETFRDMPFMFELATVLVGGLGSEEEISASQDVYFGNEKIAKQGEPLPENKLYIAQFSNYLAEELKYVGEVVKNNDPKKIRLAEDFKQATKGFYAAYALCNMIGFATYARLSVNEGASYVPGMIKTFEDMRSSVNKLEELCEDPQEIASLKELSKQYAHIKKKYLDDFARKHGQ